jgi:hypothetical protein
MVNTREVRLWTGLNALAAVVWVLLLLERSSWGRSPVSDYGSALGLVVLFFLVPAGCIAIWWRRRRRVERLSIGERRYLALSAVFLAVNWAVTWIPMAFWTGPPDDVHGLYGRRGWEFGDGNTYRLKFQFQDPSIIERIVGVAGLEPVPEPELKASWLIESEPPEWWASHDFSGYDQAFRRHSQPRLWVSRATRTAYYRSWP